MNAVTPRYVKPTSKRQMTKAVSLVTRAIKNGKLNRPSECERCGETGMILAHHHDYSKPLSVIWLCRSCHSAEHAEVGNSGFKSGLQIRLTKRNEIAVKKIAALWQCSVSFAVNKVLSDYFSTYSFKNRIKNNPSYGMNLEFLN